MPRKMVRGGDETTQKQKSIHFAKFATHTSTRYNPDLNHRLKGAN